MANEQGATLVGQTDSAEQVVSKAKTVRDIALVRQTPGWHTIPVAFSNGHGTWTITNGEAAPFIGGGEDWATIDLPPPDEDTTGHVTGVSQDDSPPDDQDAGSAEGGGVGGTWRNDDDGADSHHEEN